MVSHQFNQKTKSPPFLLRLGLPALCCCIQCMFSRNCSLLIARYLGSIRPSLPTFLAGSAARTENHEAQGGRDVCCAVHLLGGKSFRPKKCAREGRAKESRESAREKWRRTEQGAEGRNTFGLGHIATCVSRLDVTLDDFSFQRWRHHLIQLLQTLRARLLIHPLHCTALRVLTRGLFV